MIAVMDKVLFLSFLFQTSFITEEHYNYLKSNKSDSIDLLTSKFKFSSSLIDNQIKEAEKKISNSDISDKEKYLLSYKISTLKNII